MSATATEELRRRGWEPEQVRELALHVANGNPEQARHLEQRVRQVAEARARRQPCRHR